jgi:hypothetical protein
VTAGAPAGDTEHTELCETIHGLLRQAGDLSMYPTQAVLIAALQEAEDAAHAVCDVQAPGPTP